MVEDLTKTSQQIYFDAETMTKISLSLNYRLNQWIESCKTKERGPPKWHWRTLVLWKKQKLQESWRDDQRRKKGWWNYA